MDQITMSETFLRVSVIIPTFNRADVLMRAINSALNQKGCSVEVIVVDDGSTDDTFDKIKIFKDRVKYIYQKNKGVSAARNHGIAKSTGDYIAFLDSDDFFLKDDKLKIQSEFLKNNKEYGMTFSKVIFFEENNKFLSSSPYKELSKNFCDDILFIKNNIIYTPTVMVIKNVFSLAGYFDENMSVCEDIYLWRKISEKYKIHQFNNIFSAVSVRKNEKYSIKKVIKFRNILYINSFFNIKNFSIYLLIMLYIELINNILNVVYYRYSNKIVSFFK